MLSYRARSQAPPEAAWSLLSRPARWHEWAPHVRGARGLGAPEVELGARGTVRLLGAVPIPAQVTAKEPGASWTWKVGPIVMVHRVERRRDGCEVAVDLEGPPALELALALTYGPVCALLVSRLARVAERG